MSNRVFNLFLAVLIGIAAYFLSPIVAKWFLGATNFQAFGGLLLTSMGIVVLGITNNLLKVIIGLISFLSGFKIIFVALDSSGLLTGYLSFLTLLLALLAVFSLSTQNERIDG
jgi:hypothetical protein